MSRRFDNQPDRRIAENRSLVFLAFAILIALGGGAMVWQSMIRGSVPAAGGPEREASAEGTLFDPLMIRLYVPAEGMLTAVEAPVKRQPDTQALARESIVSLLAEARRRQQAVLKDLRFNEVFFEPSGAAYVDLSLNADAPRGSAWDELTALYAIVNTLALNFDEIAQVRFLIDGREAATLAGHIDISGKFTERIDLVRKQQQGAEWR